MKISILAMLLMTLVSIAFAQVPYSTVTVAGVVMNYRVTPDLQNLDCQLFGNTTGWVAVGFSPTAGMQNANVIIGFDANGTTGIRDDWGTSPSAHASDTSLGGTNDILTSSSFEVAGVTQLNFTIPLDSGDSFDRVLAIGNTYTVALGRGVDGSDNFTGAHAEFGLVDISIIQPVANDDEVVAVPENGLSLSLSPNPFRDNLVIRISGKSSSPATVSVFDSKGRKIKRLQTNVNADISLAAETYPAGIYFIKAATTLGTVSRKAIKLD